MTRDDVYAIYCEANHAFMTDNGPHPSYVLAAAIIERCAGVAERDEFAIWETAERIAAAIRAEAEGLK